MVWGLGFGVAETVQENKMDTAFGIHIGFDGGMPCTYGVKTCLLVCNNWAHSQVNPKRLHIHACVIYIYIESVDEIVYCAV